MTGLQKRLPQSRHGWVAATYLAIATILGGGGSPSAAAEILVQLAFAACAVAWILWAGPSGRNLREITWIAGLIVGLPLVQLVPLPEVFWSNLPGRTEMEESLAIGGGTSNWRPLTVSAPATIASLLAMVPVAGAALGTAMLDHRDRRALVLLTAFLALVGAALGVLQMASGPGQFRLYEVSHDFWLTAFHASRNSAADALLAGSLALTAWVASTAERRPLFRTDLMLLLILQAFLFLALFLTGSRAGIALLPVVLAIEFVMLRSIGIGQGLSRRAMVLGGLAGLLAVAGLSMSGNSRINTVLSRFDATRDFRSELWQDTLPAIWHFWPAGSGLGTFTRVFLGFERTEVLDDLFPNRAHNDFLEFFLETGALAPMVLIAGTIIVLTLFRKAWLLRPAERPMALYALGILMVIALHSFVDYPLRNMALASLAGVAVGLLGAMSRVPSSDRKMDTQE